MNIKVDLNLITQNSFKKERIQHLSKYYNDIPIVEENNRKTIRVFSDIDPNGEENWGE
jgi:hypothetical protein